MRIAIAVYRSRGICSYSLRALSFSTIAVAQSRMRSVSRCSCSKNRSNDGTFSDTAARLSCGFVSIIPTLLLCEARQRLLPWRPLFSPACPPLARRTLARPARVSSVECLCSRCSWPDSFPFRAASDRCLGIEHYLVADHAEGVAVHELDKALGRRVVGEPLHRSFGGCGIVPVDDDYPVAVIVLRALPANETGLLGGVFPADALVFADELLLVRTLGHPEVNYLDGSHNLLLSSSSDLLPLDGASYGPTFYLPSP